MSHNNHDDASAVLHVRDACGEYRAATADEVLQEARQVLSRRFIRGTQLSSPGIVRDYLRVTLGTREHEVFVLVALDSQHRLIVAIEMFRGTINAASVYPREVVKESLACNAAAVIFAHNHPSGIAEPSQADRFLTEKLKSALELVDVRVLDHLVVAGADITSFAERGWL